MKIEETRIASYLTEATQASFRRQGAGYVRRALPPLQFAYSKAEIQAELKTVDAASLEHMPYGIDGAHYQFVDLYGEGVSSVLTDQAGAWFYKRNLSPLTLKTARQTNGHDVAQSEARFAPIEQVALKPAPGNLGGVQQVMDLSGDGQNDLVQFAPPLAGYFSQDTEGEWQPFVSFRSQPNLDWNDPNLRHVELTGDGHADVLITQEGCLEWYRLMAKDRFEPAMFVTQPLDDEQGPRLVFADGTQSVYLADMNGDGLTDLVRIHNGEVCYWPNLGYGRFGAKVPMDTAPDAGLSRATVISAVYTACMHRPRSCGAAHHSGFTRLAMMMTALGWGLRPTFPRTAACSFLGITLQRPCDRPRQNSRDTPYDLQRRLAGGIHGENITSVGSRSGDGRPPLGRFRSAADICASVECPDVGYPRLSLATCASHHISLWRAPLLYRDGLSALTSRALPALSSRGGGAGKEPVFRRPRPGSPTQPTTQRVPGDLSRGRSPVVAPQHTLPGVVGGSVVVIRQRPGGVCPDIAADTRTSSAGRSRKAA
jgi:FG-GAP-like repeat